MDHGGGGGGGGHAEAALRLALESGQGRGRSFNNIKPYDLKTITGSGYTNFL